MNIRRVDGWLVDSERNPAMKYMVSTTGDGAWRCDCPAYQFRGQDKYCKHILAVQELPENKTYTGAGPKMYGGDDGGGKAPDGFKWDKRVIANGWIDSTLDRMFGKS